MRKKILQNLIMPSLLFYSAFGFASPQIQYAVNMQDGGLILKEDSGSSLNVERTYRSRSLELGFFGMGWCSDFESQIVFQGRGVIRLVNCQSSRPTLFKVNSTAASYIQNENRQDQIIIKMGFYERRIQNEWVAKYNLKGKLIEFRKNKQVFKLIYNSRGLPERILLEDQKLIQLEWHQALNLVKKIKFNNLVQNLNYSGFKLVKIQTGKDIINYAYDDLDNLIERKTLNHTKVIKINYDKAEDRVLKIDGICKESYSYKKSSPQRSLSTVSKSCQNQGSKTEFIFEYAKDTLKPSQILVSQSSLSRIEKTALNLGGAL